MHMERWKNAEMDQPSEPERDDSMGPYLCKISGYYSIAKRSDELAGMLCCLLCNTPLSSSTSPSVPTRPSLDPLDIIRKIPPVTFFPTHCSQLFSRVLVALWSFTFSNFSAQFARCFPGCVTILSYGDSSFVFLRYICFPDPCSRLSKIFGSSCNCSIHFSLGIRLLYSCIWLY